MTEKQVKVGMRVQFERGFRTVQGVVKEDRGPIGVKARHLYLIEFPRPHVTPAVGEIELPAEYFELAHEDAADS